MNRMMHIIAAALCAVAFLSTATAQAVELSTTAQLVFPGATLEDLSTHALAGRFCGSNIKDDGVEATFFYRQETTKNDALTKVTYQLQTLDDEYVKASTVEFTNGVGGVYAKLADGKYSNYNSTLSNFGSEPLSTNSGTSNYIPYDLQLFAPATTISVNFTDSSKNLDSSSSVRYGGGAYAVPYSSWNNMAAANNGTATFDSVGVKITGTRGSYRCSSLSTTKDLRHGYIDESSSYMTPTVTVTNIPYAYYRVVAYASSNYDSIYFGYMTINGTNYTGTAGTTSVGTDNWGATGGSNAAKGMREGVNYLVSGVFSNSTATIVGHRVGSPYARGCISAVQIVSLPTATYTATIDDGGDKTYSSLSWDSTVRAPLKDASLVVNVNEDTTLDMGEATNVFAVTFNVADGKVLTLAGGDITATLITVNGQVVVGNATHLQGNVCGSGTIVYPAEPSGADFSAWEGCAWVCDTSSGVATAMVLDASTRSLSGWALPIGTEGINEWIVPLTETREEFGKGAMTVTNIPSGVTAVGVTRPDSTTTNVTVSAGTATLTEAVQIAGAATMFDITFKNNSADVGTKNGTCTYKAVESATLKYDSNASFNNDAWDASTGVYIKHHPYVDGAASSFVSLEDFTAVVVGTVSPTASRQFIHLGSSTDGAQGLLIATTENEDEVIIAANTGSSVDVAGGVKASVPNAATARHAFVVIRKGNTFNVWVDGVKRGSFTVSSDFVLGRTAEAGGVYSGIQVGSDFGGTIKKANTYAAVEDNDSETGVANVIRVFDYAISDAQAEAVVNAYPYVSQGGLFSRTLSADGTLSQADAWTKDGSEGTYAVPEGTTVDDVYYNPSATLNVTAESEINVNTNLAVETLTVGGSAAVSFVSDGTNAVTAGTAIINSPVAIEYGALNISAAAVQLGSSGSLAFDCSEIDISDIWEQTRFQLTGLIDRNDEKVTLSAAPTAPDKSAAIVYNENGFCYDLVISTDHDFVRVDNERSTAVEATDDMVINGIGGLKATSFVMPENSVVLYDPIKTPVKVSATPTFASGAKLRLTSDYASMSLGRLVLLTYTGSATFDNSLFDSSTIASGATYALSEVDAPDGTSEQLVLTVGDYENNAKEIRILPIGDSITHGYVKNSQQTQYRTAIAARLAANGYKPVMLGLLNTDSSGTAATCDAAGVQQPDDWIWHCGVNADRIITSTSGTAGGVRDNLHVYLDIAGNPDVVTLLIGTNDLGAGTGAEETFVAYTNLVWDIYRQRPQTKIVASTILERSDDTEANDKVTSFNASLLANIANLPATYCCTNLHDAAPLSIADGYFDGLHPTRKGCAPISEGFAAKIMEQLPLATYEGPIDDMLTDEAQTALGVAGVAATSEGAALASYTNNMVHVFTIDAASSNNNFSAGVPYTTINQNVSLARRVKKAGYFMELVRVGTSRRRYVWVDFDATGKTIDEIDFPWSGSNLDFVVSDMHVYSNDGSIHNIAPEVTGVKGAIEGTYWDYVAGDDNGDVPADINELGWNDTLQSNGGYGCFQAHRIFESGEHWNDAEVLFAWDAWGPTSTARIDDIGIGTFFLSGAFSSNRSVDYTFSDDATKGAASKLDASAYQVRHLEIWAELDEATPGVWVGSVDGDLNNADNWEDGQVPSGVDVFIGSTSAVTLTNTVGGSFSPSSITFTSGTAPVTIAGEAITGVSAITSLSTMASHEITAPVHFSGKISVIQPAMSYDLRTLSSVRFSGGAYGTSFDADASHYVNGHYFLSEENGLTATVYANSSRYGWLEGSSLTVPSVTDVCELALGQNADVPGGAFTTGVFRTSSRLSWHNNGEFVVTNEVVITLPSSSDLNIACNYSAADYKFEKMTLGASGVNKWFYFGLSYANATWPKNIWIGAGGLNFADSATDNTCYCFGQGRSLDVITISPWHSDYTIAAKTRGDKDFVLLKNTLRLGTTDENGDARTVTCNGRIYGNSATDRTIEVFGTGRFVANCIPNALSAPVIVTNTATLAINPGKSMTAGTITVHDGATFEVAQSGTVALVGDLALKSGSKIGFNFTDRTTVPVLDATDKTVTFDSAETTNVTVRIASSDGIRPTGGAKVLTSGGGFTDATVSLAEHAPDWITDISVNDDGNIVIDVKPEPLIILLR